MTQLKYSVLLQRNRATFQQRPTSQTSGFTLLEMIVMLAIAGSLALIVPGGWQIFWERQQLNIAQEELFQAMQEARHRAKQQRRDWRTSFRTNSNQVVQWQIHTDSVQPLESQWNSLDPNIRIDPETTLRKVKNFYQIEFNHKGRINGQLGRITLATKQGGKTQRCVIVSTLLGVIRTGENRSKAKDDKFCY